MDNNIQLFSSEEFGSVRVVLLEGNPWFVAKDVCDVLEIGNASEALRGLDDDERSTIRITEGGPERNIINESGLYSLILRSRKPEAKKFKKWITSEVLPSIRKHGAYMTPEKIHEVMSDPRSLAQLLNTLADEQDKNKALSEQIAQDAPKVLLANTITGSDDSILIGSLAKLLNNQGIKIGRNRLFTELRDAGLLSKQRGESWNIPTQRAIEKGYFEVIERPYLKKDGEKGIRLTTKVTGEGQLYLVSYFITAGF